MTTVLIVEDNPTHRRLAVQLLGLGGYAALEAGDAETGLAIAAAERPDLVVMDLMLPGMDGLEAVSALKADERTAAIPVIVVTSYGSHAVEKDAEGVYSVLAKPYHYKDFLAAIRDALADGAA